MQNQIERFPMEANFEGLIQLLAKNLYPEGHPYSWTVIGEMEDLFNATVDDVKAFHQKFYVPNNATLVVAGIAHVTAGCEMMNFSRNAAQCGLSISAAQSGNGWRLAKLIRLPRW